MAAGHCARTTALPAFPLRASTYKRCPRASSSPRAAPPPFPAPAAPPPREGRRSSAARRRSPLPAPLPPLQALGKLPYLPSFNLVLVPYLLATGSSIPSFSSEPPPSRRRAPPVSGETAATRSWPPFDRKSMAQINPKPQVKPSYNGQPKPPPSFLQKYP
jgi:hypothetical protein